SDIAALYIKVGVKNIGTVFLHTDAQIPDERFLVLINDMLASGDILDLFNDEEADMIVSSIRLELRGLGLIDSRDNCWNFFIERIKRQLKVVLCFSPVGFTLRTRARKFPALVNCTAIDWFHPWPQLALQSVSSTFIDKIPGLEVEDLKARLALQEVELWQRNSDIEALIAKIGQQTDKLNQERAVADAEEQKVDEFLQALVNFDKEHISEATVRCVRDDYLKDPEFNPEFVRQKSSAAAGLCAWVINIIRFHEVHTETSFSENVRWAHSVAHYHEQEETLCGDVLLTAAFISYAGSFSKKYRRELLDNLWMPFLRSERWPLLIDPQLQGIKWIKSRYGNTLKVVSLGQKGYVDVIEQAVVAGDTVLIENLEETIDPVIDPLLGRHTIKKGSCIKVGDKECFFHPGFRLILHTKLANPHYKPEIQAQTTLINFTVTRDGLEDQLLAQVVNQERPDLEQLKVMSFTDEFRGLDRDIEGSPKRWKKLVESECPEKENFPQEWKGKSSLQKLIMMRALRPDRMTYALRNFVEEKLGVKYTEGRKSEFAKSFRESGPAFPMFFTLSPGNIHLVARWLGALEKLLERCCEHSHSDYRVFMSAEPTSTPQEHIIPQGILENAIKITNEPPTGMHANLHAALDNFDQDILDQCSREQEFKTILFSLCYFHACVAERRKFGPQGWNRKYPFNTGDLTISVNVLYNYLEANAQVPWEDLRYLFGEIMYGGHITDDWDRRLCRTYLEEYMQPNQFDRKLSLAPGFVVPSNLDYQGYHDFIDEMLPHESPVHYGLHPNAEIEFLTVTSDNLFHTLLELQSPDAVMGEGASHTLEEKVKTILDEILEKLPEEYNMSDITSKTAERSPYILVCFQECERMNMLIFEIRRSLKELDLGLKGELAMSSEMEKLQTALFFDNVPDTWTKLAYPSTYSLAIWYNDVMQRCKELDSWTQDLSLPSVVWLSGLFNPQSFLTAVMQSLARKNEWPLDKVNLTVDVTKKYKEEFNQPAREGAYVYGLYMEGARWDTQTGVITEARLKELTPAMPVISVRAVPNDRQETRNIYECPLYKTKIRGPTYVWTFSLKTRERPAKWVLAGVALLLSV
ncbi:hypothetical protein XENOCAPTIV_026913, partial [Xenoophorus captivus]